jgi:heterodisulfide reductase subunit A-like polyferredoxin
MLRRKFEYIKNTKKPKLNKSWMCSKLCHFGKTTFENTNILPIIEYRDNQTCQQGTCMTKCEQVKHDLELHGIDHVVKQYKHQKHTFGLYKAPGST